MEEDLGGFGVGDACCGGEESSRKEEEEEQPDEAGGKLEILDVCFALGRACNRVVDWDDAERYYKRANEWYEEQLRRNNEKALEATHDIIIMTCSSRAEKIEKVRDLFKRMERALGEENVVT